MLKNLGIILLIFNASWLSAAEEAAPVADGNSFFNYTTVLETTEEVTAAPAQRSAGLVARFKRYAIGIFTKVNWFTAQRLCAAEGMTLASVNSIAESKFLKHYLIEHDVGILASFWLSGTDASDDGNWFWTSNGRLLDYRNFRDPSRGASRLDNNDSAAKCLQVLPDGSWDTDDCFQRKFFICENRCPLDSYSTPLNPDMFDQY